MSTPRYPSGEVRHRNEDASLLGKLARLNSMKDLLTEIGRPEWGTELARLYAKGLIVNAQKLAGDEWAKLVASHRKIVILSPSGHPSVSKAERLGGRDEKTYEDDLIERIAERYDSAFCSVVEAGRDGIQTMRAINHLCVDNEPLSYDQLLLAKKGLDRLASHFGLTGVVKYAGSGKAD